MEGIEASDQSATRLMPAALVFAISFSVILILHFPLLRLPYFWDEAGYYIPAARDLFLSGTLIPHSTPSNAHPPVIMAYLSACWKIAGYSLVTTRVAMLVIAAFSLTGLVRLAEVVANRQVAIATAVCTAIYPVFFVQSSLAQVDLAAAGFTFWGLHAYIQNRPWAIGFWMSLAALTKETAILAPVGVGGVGTVECLSKKRPMATHGKRFEESWATTSWLSSYRSSFLPRGMSITIG